MKLDVSGVEKQLCMVENVVEDTKEYYSHAKVDWNDDVYASYYQLLSRCDETANACCECRGRISQIKNTANGVPAAKECTSRVRDFEIRANSICLG